jgi:hypothetical protein
MTSPNAVVSTTFPLGRATASNLEIQVGDSGGKDLRNPTLHPAIDNFPD